MPVISRDEIKEGYVNTHGVKHDQLPPDTNGVVTNFFFEIVSQYLAGKISVVIEAAFQHTVWEPRMPKILELGTPFIVVCSVDGMVAAKRHLQRGLDDPNREFYHGDKRVGVYRKTGVMSPPSNYTAPDFNVPTVHVSTEGQYSPSIDEIVKRIRLSNARRDIRYQAVIFKDHRVLLLKIAEEDQAFWVIPGGGREGSESEEECVIREVWEETHLQIKVERLILDEKVSQDPFYERHKTYLCQIVGGVARPGIEPELGDAESPIKDIGWFDLRAVDSWDALGASPPFAFSLLKRIRERLGYERET